MFFEQCLKENSVNLWSEKWKITNIHFFRVKLSVNFTETLLSFNKFTWIFVFQILTRIKIKILQLRSVWINGYESLSKCVSSNVRGWARQKGRTRPLSLISYPLYTILYPLFFISYTLTPIPHRLSIIPYLLSPILYPLSHIPYHISLIPYP